jgi:hypothetical protein
MGPKGQAHGTEVPGCIPEIAGEGKVNSRNEVNIAVQVLYLRMKCLKNARCILLLLRMRICYMRCDTVAVHR